MYWLHFPIIIYEFIRKHLGIIHLFAQISFLLANLHLYTCFFIEMFYICVCAFIFQYGLSPLHLAAQSGHEGLVRLLLNSPGVQAEAATMLLVSKLI